MYLIKIKNNAKEMNAKSDSQLHTKLLPLHSLSGPRMKPLVQEQVNEPSSFVQAPF